jgi:DNA adenine methylase
VAQFERIAQRLQLVHLECADAVSVIQRLDGTGTTFYLDPPYLLSGRSAAKLNTRRDYRFEMFDGPSHVALLKLAMALKGTVIISGRSDRPTTTYSGAGRVIR